MIFQPDTPEDVLFGEGLSDSQQGLSSPINQSQFRKQLQHAQKISSIGEEVFQRWLLQQGYSDSDFLWVSKTRARSAYDFELLSVQWPSEHNTLFVCVKTTQGDFATDIHMGLAELRWAAEKENYRIARVSQISETSATIDILLGVSRLASQALEKLQNIPSGVNIDSVNFSPHLLQKEESGSVIIDNLD